MTSDEVIDGLLEREGGFSVRSEDKGGPTKFGITALTLGNYLGLPRPATKQEVYELRREVAATIYRVKYIAQPGFTPENIPFEPLRVQMIDFGVNSGPERAIRWLQRVVRLPVTGQMSDRLREELRRLNDLGVLDLVNDALVAARLYMIDAFTDAHAEQKVFEEGLESRALTFFLARP